MRRQKGVTLSGLLLWSVVLVFAALLAFKIGPPYIEYLSIQAQLKAIANDAEGRSGVRRVVEDLFNRRSAIENISAVRAQDILISKEGDRVVLSFEYAVCVPIVFNIRACMDYNPTSGK
jgi:Iap family predicted aminopeptidase